MRLAMYQIDSRSCKSLSNVPRQTISDFPSL